MTVLRDVLIVVLLAGLVFGMVCVGYGMLRSVEARKARRCGWSCSNGQWRRHGRFVSEKDVPLWVRRLLGDGMGGGG